jgi:hypothetical protein
MMLMADVSAAIEKAGELKGLFMVGSPGSWVQAD